MTDIHSYPRVHNLGHPAIAGLFDGVAEGESTLVVQEKVDGSQFSFRRNLDDTMSFRSKGAIIYEDNVQAMFSTAVNTARRLWNNLIPGWTYRGEVLSKPKHNVLAYERVPVGGIILFDIEVAPNDFLPSRRVEEIGRAIGLEVVPTFPWAPYNPETIAEQMETISVLGGQKIEGLVFKNYGRFGIDGKVLMGKHVSEAFKEVHRGEWRAQNPTKTDIVQGVIAGLRTPARWQKAVQHLAEQGLLQHAPQDIGPLMREVGQDIRAEEAEAIKEALFKHAWPIIQRGVTKGLPEWYKQTLVERQFEEAGE